MANYFTLFSNVIPNLSAEEETWLRQQLELVRVLNGQEYTEGQLPDDVDPSDADWSGFRLCRNIGTEDPKDTAHRTCDYEFRDDDRPDRWGRHLWLYTEETGAPEVPAHLAQEFLRRYRPGEYWWMTYAWTCSRPRVGDFGGGAVFVTADAIEWEDAEYFIQKQEQAFAKAKEAPSPMP